MWPLSPDRMETYPVSRLVSNTRNNSANCIESLSQQPSLFYAWWRNGGLGRFRSSPEPGGGSSCTPLSAADVKHVGRKSLNHTEHDTGLDGVLLPGAVIIPAVRAP